MNKTISKIYAHNTHRLQMNEYCKEIVKTKTQFFPSILIFPFKEKELQESSHLGVNKEKRRIFLKWSNNLGIPIRNLKYAFRNFRNGLPKKSKKNNFLKPFLNI